MKSLFCLIGLALTLSIASPTYATEPLDDLVISKAGCPDGLWITGGCYTVLKDGRNKRVFVDTWRHLMQNKTAVWRVNELENKDALEVTKGLRAKLLELPEVSGVHITTRTVLILVYPLDEIPVERIKEAFKYLGKGGEE